MESSLDGRSGSKSWGGKLSSLNLSLFSGEVTSRSIVSSRDSSLIWPSFLTRRVLFSRILARTPVISFSTLSRVATMVSTLVRSISLGDINLFPTKMLFLCGLGISRRTGSSFPRGDFPSYAWENLYLIWIGGVEVRWISYIMFVPTLV